MKKVDWAQLSLGIMLTVWGLICIMRFDVLIVGVPVLMIGVFMFLQSFNQD